MKKSNRFVPLLLLVVSILRPLLLLGQNSAEGIPGTQIEQLDAKRVDAGKAVSAARKKLAVRRVIREAEALIKKHATSP